MSWRYRCHNCDETSDWVTRTNAERIQDEHRTHAHRGLNPRDTIESDPKDTDYTSAAYIIAAIAVLGVVLWIRDLFS